ncbi:MAG: hypothetical protein EBR81_13485 [Proteobacteria bacterium]|nr:hypothetical protein [Pseudomonadota bacterium]
MYVFFAAETARNRKGQTLLAQNSSTRDRPTELKLQLGRFSLSQVTKKRWKKAGIFCANT